MTAAATLELQPRDCPKFGNCSAPLCPLDADWRLRYMHATERACFYLLEAAKDGAAARFEGCADEGIYRRAAHALPAMVAAVGALRKRVNDASVTGSRVGRKPPQRKVVA